MHACKSPFEQLQHTVLCRAQTCVMRALLLFMWPRHLHGVGL
jgi:hypothetical protein